MDVQRWLSSQGLQQYAEAFAAERIDEDALRGLTEDDLKALGVSARGDRKRLLAAIAALPQTTASDDEAALRAFVDCWPSVLALPLKDYLDEADPRIKLWAACDLVELILRFLVMVGVARAARDGVVPDGVAKVLAKHIEHPTLWDWRRMADALARGAQRTDSFSAKADLFLLDVLAPLLAGSIKPPSAESSLARLRNRLAHGAGITKKQAKHLLEAWKSPFEAAIAQASWLGEMTLLVRPLGNEWGELRGLTVQPISIAAPATEVDRVVTSGMYVAYGERLLALWPLGLYGPPKKAGADAPESEPAPQVYARRGEMHLEYTPLGEGEECESIGDAEALMGFVRLFQIDRTRAEIVGESYTVRGFEQDMRKDSDRLLGRQEVIGTLERSVRDTANGVIWVTGTAGVGKSFVMSRVAIDLLEEGPKGWLILPYRFRIVDSRCSRESFLRFARERIDSWLDRPFEEGEAERVSGERSQPIDRFKNSLEAVPADRRVLFILDGLDEITERDPEFAREVPLALRQHNVLWVCCGRPQSGLQEAFRRAKAIEPFTGGLPRMTKEDIREMLVEKLGPLRRRLLRGDRDKGDEVVNLFVDRVEKNSDGLPIYVKYVVGDVLSGLLSPDAPGQLPPSLAQYHAELLRRLQVGDLHQVLTPLAATLAVAREPLTVEELAALLARRSFVKPDEAGVALVAKAMSAIESMVRLAPEPDGGEGYALWHQSLREHMFTSPDVSMAIATARQAMADAGLRPAGDAAERYLYRQGVGHLLADGRRSEALALMMDSTYAIARALRLPNSTGVEGYVKDLIDWLLPSRSAPELRQAVAEFSPLFDRFVAEILSMRSPRLAHWVAQVICFRLAPALAERVGGRAAARIVLTKSTTLYQKLVETDSSNADYLQELAAIKMSNALNDLMKPAEEAKQAKARLADSLQLVRRLLAKEPEDERLLLHLLWIHINRGDIPLPRSAASALEEYARALSIAAGLCDRRPDDPAFLHALAVCHMRQGASLRAVGSQESEQCYLRAKEVAQRALKVDPHDIELQQDLIAAYEGIASLHEPRDPDEALVLHRRALSLAEALLKRDPENAASSLIVVRVSVRVGHLVGAEERAALYQRALDIVRVLHGADPEFAVYQRYRASLSVLCASEVADNDLTQAQSLYLEAINAYQNLAARNPFDRHLREQVVGLYFMLGKNTRRTAPAIAAEWFIKGAGELEPLVVANPTSAGYQGDLVRFYAALSDLTREADPKRCCEWTAKAVTASEGLVALLPQEATVHRAAGALCCLLGRRVEAIDPTEMIYWYRKGIAYIKRAVVLSPDNLKMQRELARNCGALATAIASSNLVEARELYGQAMAITERLASVSEEDRALHALIALGSSVLAGSKGDGSQKSGEN
jgi:tetratricopeptide (TPR) repeat protein